MGLVDTMSFSWKDLWASRLRTLAKRLSPSPAPAVDNSCPADGSSIYIRELKQYLKDLDFARVSDTLLWDPEHTYEIGTLAGKATTCVLSNTREASIVLSKFGPECEMETHLHKSSYEYVLVLQGTMDLIFWDKIVTLNRGDSFTIPPNTAHSATVSDKLALCLIALIPGSSDWPEYRET